MARAVARTRFSRFLSHLPPSAQDRYWGEMEVFYYPLHAYEEVLAAFADRPRQSRSLLASMEKFTSHLLGVETTWAPMPEDRRVAGLRKFTGRPASDSLDDLKLTAEEYERIRQTMDAGDERTYLMTALLGRAVRIAGEDGVAQVAEVLFKANTDGGRVIGLGLAARDPRRTQVDMVITAIGEMRSPFEQYHALVLAEQLLPLLDPTAKKKLRAIIQSQMTRTITTGTDRWGIADRILSSLTRESLRTAWTVESPVVEFPAGGAKQVCVEIRPPSAVLHYADVDERHGPWVGTRKVHTVTLPKSYRLGRDLVTNAAYWEFVAAKGYQRDELWPQGPRNRARVLTADDKGTGPAPWVKGKPLAAKNRHPVTGICFHEAEAFIHWLNREAPVTGWRWTLPTEDMWEYVARTETGLTYPWGDAFEEHKCNSREAGIGDTSDVEQFASGASRQGCRDMAGNVWEFVLPAEGVDSGCVLRGGSYKNDRSEVRSYLRLFGVPPLHRAPDFGFRVAQVEH
jgi:formylglycine-generating enzyme required for sulfatase activity